MSFIPPARAVFASDPAQSRGREHACPPSPSRTEYQRDRDRILHSSAFRRLKQKTQVFVAHEGDYYRTRLTHSLEVAQIARSVSRVLGLDEDLAEALALAHDLGHPPFGHAGEEALQECMQDHGGFDHNAQSLRVVTMLEQCYPEFDGLNLSWEMREGLLKHNGPLIGAAAGGSQLSDLSPSYLLYPQLELLEPDTYAGPEAQIASLADDIAYNNHDLDDGLAAGLFTKEELLEIPLVGEVFHAVCSEFPELGMARIRAEVVRRLIGIWVKDLISETQGRIKDLRPGSVAEVRALGVELAGFSASHVEKQQPLRQFFEQSMYRHVRVNQMRSRARRIINDLFALFMSDPETLPADWQSQLVAGDEGILARTVCDYIAGMTDVYAIAKYKRLFLLDGWG